MFLLTAVHSSQLMCIRSAIYIHYLVCRECLGPIIGGALVYRVGFRTMTAVRFIGILKFVTLKLPQNTFFFGVFCMLSSIGVLMPCCGRAPRASTLIVAAAVSIPLH